MPGRQGEGDPMADDAWWRGAVIYEIYPRSFQDSDDDGIGDLPGITARLEHVAGLGVDAIWIAPFMRSPQQDFGYDVEDYRAVDPRFGTLDDFDRLLRRAHDLGLRVIIDLVASHTSDRHPWFVESRGSRRNPKAKWYVWADPKPDGTPPNNWLSVFGGPAWQWEPRRRQYYLHNFLAAQPDLNWHDPALRQAMLSEATFWLERGVDGFRLDAIDFALHDPLLRDDPPRFGDEPLPGGLRAGTPYARQRHRFSKAHPAVPERVLAPLRRLADRHGAMLLGELSGDGQLERAAIYTQGDDALHCAYTFDLLEVPLQAAAIRRTITALEAVIGDGWPCWSFGNHDVVRAVTRLGGRGASPALTRLLPALLGSLRGTVCLYQGEELGLPEADLDFADLRDPVGLALYPEFPGRDGCRTPMPWCSDAPYAGFSTVRPWLPVPDAHLALAVDRQVTDPNSVLNATRRFLTWRRGQPALRLGRIRFLDAPEPLLAFTREHPDGSLLCLFNLGAEPAIWTVPFQVGVTSGHGFSASLKGRTVSLPGHGAFFGRLG